jgi:hypothetical protein
VVESLIAQRALVPREGHWDLHKAVAEVEGGVPQSLRQMIEQQLARLTPAEQQLVEAASVAGAEFSAAAAAAGMEAAVSEVEEQCARLARREQFLQTRGTEEWPDATVAARYGFIHSLYQEVLYARVTAGRRVGLHQRIGQRLEAAYGKRAREIAAALAVHFEQGRDYPRAVEYLQQAGENAIQCSAHQEALSLLTNGLALLKTLPDTPERAQQELQLQLTLGTSLSATRGFAAPELEKVYTRMRELSQQVGDTPQLFSILHGGAVFYLGRAAFHTARELCGQLFTLAQRTQDPVALLAVHFIMAATLVLRGEFLEAQEQAEQGIGLYDRYRSQRSPWRAHHGGVGCLNCTAWVLWMLGYPDQALRRVQEALTLA